MKVKWKQADPSLKTIKDVVMKHTGKTESELLNDDKEYEIRGIDGRKWIIGSLCRWNRNTLS